jgi:DNA polymerase-1
LASKLVLIDGLNLFYRNQHRLGHLTTNEGKASGAYYGSIRSLISIVKDFQPTHLIVCWDGGAYDRKEIDPNYKGHRSRNDNEDFWHQVRSFQKLIWLLGYQNAMVPGKEADDVIASYAFEASCAGLETIVVTEDHDMYQILAEQEGERTFGSDDPGIAAVHMFKPMRREFVTAEDFVAWQEGAISSPGQYIWMMAMTGCDTDGVEGIRGIGDKRARNFLRKHQDLNTAIENEPILKENEALIRRNLRLVKLDTACQLPVSLEDAAIKPMQDVQVGNELRMWEFSSILKQLGLAQEVA